MSISLIEKRITEAINSARDASADEIALQSGISGLTGEMIRQGKTPKDIAALWLHARLQGKSILAPKATDSVKSSFPLLPFSQIVFDSMRKGGRDVWTFDVTLRTDDRSIDPGKLRQSIETAITHHPVFRCRIDENGMQNPEDEYCTPYFNYSVTESDGHIYLSFSINRILGDATSFILLFEDISRAYEGKPLSADTYLEYLQRHEAHRQSEEYAEHGRILHQQLDSLDCPVRPKTDFPIFIDDESLVDESLVDESSVTESFIDNSCSGVESCVGELYDDYSSLKDSLALLERDAHLSLNAAFTMATALAIMDYNETDQAALTWAYVGRENEAEQHIMGSLHRDIPFVLSRKQDEESAISRSHSSCRSSLINVAREQMQQGVVLSDYPYTFQPSSRARWKNAVNVLLQPTFVPRLAGIDWEFCQESSLHAHDNTESKNKKESYCLLDIEICPSPLMLTFKYSSAHYKPASIQRFAELVRKNIEWIAGKNI